MSAIELLALASAVAFVAVVAPGRLGVVSGGSVKLRLRRNASKKRGGS